MNLDVFLSCASRGYHRSSSVDSRVCADCRQLLTGADLVEHELGPVDVAGSLQACGLRAVSCSFQASTEQSAEISIEAVETPVDPAELGRRRLAAGLRRIWRLLSWSAWRRRRRWRRVRSIVEHPVAVDLRPLLLAGQARRRQPLDLGDQVRPTHCSCGRRLDSDAGLCSVCAFRPDPCPPAVVCDEQHDPGVVRGLRDDADVEAWPSSRRK